MATRTMDWYLTQMGALRALKTSTITPIDGLSRPQIEPEHGRTAFSHVYILYRDYVGLLFHYQQWQHAQWTADIWPKWVLRALKTSTVTAIDDLSRWHLLTACRDLKLSQNMVLPSVMSMYSIETMLGSCFIFNNGNKHNGLIFDPIGCSAEPPKPAR